MLYGGTAIALRLGHRQSIDFDFFCEMPLNRDAMWSAMPFLSGAALLQDQRNTLTALVPTPESTGPQVKLSFFGSISFGRVGEPGLTDDGVAQVASLEDLMATKLKVLLQRAEAKDYADIAAMLDAGVGLADGLAAARAMFGPNFQPSESLKALAYFDDGDLTGLGAAVKSKLVRAVGAVRQLPEAAIRSRRLAAT